MTLLTVVDHVRVSREGLCCVGASSYSRSASLLSLGPSGACHSHYHGYHLVSHYHGYHLVSHYHGYHSI